MGFGTVAPGAFQEATNHFVYLVSKDPAVRKLLDEDKCCVEVAIDDVNISADTEEDVLIILQTLFKVCREWSIRLNLEKSTFMEQEVELLGLQVGYRQWWPTPAKLVAVQDFKVKTRRDLRAFLRLFNFLRRHVP